MDTSKLYFFWENSNGKVDTHSLANACGAEFKYTGSFWDCFSKMVLCVPAKSNDSVRWPTVKEAKQWAEIWTQFGIPCEFIPFDKMKASWKSKMAEGSGSIYSKDKKQPNNFMGGFLFKREDYNTQNRLFCNHVVIRSIFYTYYANDNNQIGLCALDLYNDAVKRGQEPNMWFYFTLAFSAPLGYDKASVRGDNLVHFLREIDFDKFDDDLSLRCPIANGEKFMEKVDSGGLGWQHIYGKSQRLRLTNAERVKITDDPGDYDFLIKAFEKKPEFIKYNS